MTEKDIIIIVGWAFVQAIGGLFITPLWIRITNQILVNPGIGFLVSLGIGIWLALATTPLLFIGVAIGAILYWVFMFIFPQGFGGA